MIAAMITFRWFASACLACALVASSVIPASSLSLDGRRQTTPEEWEFELRNVPGAAW